MRNTVRKHREAWSDSRRELAIVCGVSEQTIENIEMKESEPKVGLAMKIAAHYRTTVVNVFGDMAKEPDGMPVVEVQGTGYLFDYVCDKMDAELAADITTLTLEDGDYTEQAFVNAYVNAHRARFGEEFLVL